MIASNTARALVETIRHTHEGAERRFRSFGELLASMPTTQPLAIMCPNPTCREGFSLSQIAPTGLCPRHVDTTTGRECLNSDGPFEVAVLAVGGEDWEPPKREPVPAGRLMCCANDQGRGCQSPARFMARGREFVNKPVCVGCLNRWRRQDPSIETEPLPVVPPTKAVSPNGP